MEEKYGRDKQALVEQYAKIRKTVEETEKERYDYELEKFRKDQTRSLDSHKTDIERLKTEKKKIQADFAAQLEGLKADLERKVELQKKQMQE